MHSPEEKLQLAVEVPDERAPGDYLSVAVVERQAAVAHVLTVDAFGSGGDTDDLRFLYVRPCWGGRRNQDTSVKAHNPPGQILFHSPNFAQPSRFLFSRT